MDKIIGKYQHVKNENTEEYFAAVGVPYLIRKMIAMSSPTMEIIKDGEHWIIKNSSLMRTTELKFLLGEEYEEKMPNGEVLKNTTTLDVDNNLLTDSVIVQSGLKTSRHYVFDGESCVITLEHEKCKCVAKRYFSKVQ